MKNPLIEADELAALLDKPHVKLVDATYGTPNARQLYKQQHIGNAVYFDIDEIADPHAPLAHTIPTAEHFAHSVSALGIGNDDLVIVYDQDGISFAAARVWWMFRLYGHDNVRVLNGGLPWWVAQGLPTSATPTTTAQSSFKATLRPHLVKTMEEVLKASQSGSEGIIDARGAGRFAGLTPEPRPGLRAGHIPGSSNLPYTDLLDGATGRLKSQNELEKTIKNHIVEDKPLITSCGSGVTACVVTLALFAAGKEDVAVYDGSWTEWGAVTSGMPVDTGT